MRIYPLQLLPLKTYIDFIKISKIIYLTSLMISILCIYCISKFGFNFGIDFIGGISIELRSEEPVDLAKMRTVLNELNIGEVSIQKFNEEDNDFSLKIGNKDNKDLQKNVVLVKQVLQQKFSGNFDYRKIDFVGPQVGKQLINSGLIALSLSLLAIMIYISYRFEWYFGVGILVALIHDALLSLGFMSISNLDFNLSTVAAILTIIGYSVNDSVVIYDRIRENIRKFAKKPITEIINLSVNETLSRTTLTVLTTLLANLALILYGGEVIRSFSVLVFFGIIIGTYSSIFISAPILILLKKNIGNKKAKKI